ncbi:tetratricopeptide repeat protein [Thermocoleostomius sinensis]|uniref:Tetratricopeptide repeat protein n=1 Tax=Thermocoleostomius sinensis A174 TaxID=2016057 RepID=A0A9E8ZDA6_9CYAN|nr:tetratricopeptide repeat protein [Thermocoleostomius sinensis]WAL59145.1 tetratricopeptide repeat protein [Thermocoleostomius sinensis A174]
MANVPLRKILGLNQQTYQRLKLALDLNLRRQIFIAVCDDLVLRDRLATQLQTELNQAPALELAGVDASRLPSAVQHYPRLVSVQLSLEDPNPLIQVAQWLNQSPPPIIGRSAMEMPAFQILGIEHLTRQSPAVQRLFLTHLQTIERHLPLLDLSLLFWITQPWFHTVSQSVPEFWRCRTGVFEFIGDPTPLTITLPERFGAQSSRLDPSSETVPPLEYAVRDPVIHERGDEQNAGNHAAAAIETPPTDAATPTKEDSPELAENPWLTLLHDEQLDRVLADAEDGLDATFTLDDLESNPWLQAEGLGDETSAIDATQSHSLLPEDLAAELVAELTNGDVPDNPLLAWVEQFIQHQEDIQDQATPIESPSKSQSPSSAEPPATADNPWLPLGENLNQLYETTDDPDLAQPASEPPMATNGASPTVGQTSSAATAQPPLSELPTHVGIHLPDGLPDADRIQRILQHIEELHQRNASSTVLIDAYRSVGNLFRDRVEQGDATPQNLSIAIQAYEQVLVRLPEVSPLWVDILNDLGNLYWMTSRLLPTSQGLAYLQQGIQAYQLAITKIDPQTQAQTYPMVQNNLGAAYADLARHDNPVDNLELSVQSYREALRYRTPESDPLRYASTQNNLGTTYWNLAQYKEQKANLKLAITAYSEALQYYNPDQEPLNYAMIQNNLGTAYWNLAQHEPHEDWLSLAVSAYQMALTYRTREAVPAAHAATQNNLGTAYWHLANQTDHPQERLDHLQHAIVAYEASLQAAAYLQQQSNAIMLNFDLFATHNNLGLAHYQFATDSMNGLSTTEQTTHLEAAILHHVLALQGWAEQPNLRQTAFNCIVQTIRAAYNQQGLAGQSLMLSKVPGDLLPEILPKL